MTRANLSILCRQESKELGWQDRQNGRRIHPWLNDQTRLVEKRYQELGGQITVIVKEGEGHFPSAPKDVKPVVDFITARAQ